MEIIGRITADATVTETSAGKKVVNFSIAINDTYKARGQEAPTKITTYVNCAYWMSDAIAPYLTKGTLVELYGRMGMSAWINREGEAKASLNFHVNSIKLHGKGGLTETKPAVTAEPLTNPADDLPF
jgi:single-strand DNA-binding protein